MASFKPFSWTCAYCGQDTTVTEPNFSDSFHSIITQESRFGTIGLRQIAIACPNQSCRELTLGVHLTKAQHNNYEWRQDGDPIDVFPLMPRSRAKPQPRFIPQEIRENYLEACLILRDSPKASAAMSRRCLQGIIRDFWNLPEKSRGNLGAELNCIKNELTEDTWAAVHAVRSVGDIGAHMEKDVNTIIEVEPEEADLLLQLIETLLEDWYVERHKREARNSSLKALAESKLEQKKDAKKLANKDRENTGETPSVTDSSKIESDS